MTLCISTRTIFQMTPTSTSTQTKRHSSANQTLMQSRIHGYRRRIRSNIHLYPLHPSPLQPSRTSRGLHLRRKHHLPLKNTLHRAVQSYLSHILHYERSSDHLKRALRKNQASEEIYLGRPLNAKSLNKPLHIRSEQLNRYLDKVSQEAATRGSIWTSIPTLRFRKTSHIRLILGIRRQVH